MAKPARASLLRRKLARVDVELLLQVLKIFRELEERVVERRPRGGGDEPVGPHVGHGGLGQPVDLLGRLAGGLVLPLVVLQAIGIVAEQFVPEVVLVPADVAEVDGEDGLLAVDRLRHDDLGLPAQAVDQLRDGGPGQPQVVVADRLVVVQVVNREVAEEGPIGLGQRLEVVADGDEDVLLPLERAVDRIGGGNVAPASIQRPIRARSASEGLGPEGGMSFSTPTRSQIADSSGLPGTT